MAQTNEVGKDNFLVMGPTKTQSPKINSFFHKSNLPYPLNLETISKDIYVFEIAITANGRR